MRCSQGKLGTGSGLFDTKNVGTGKGVAVTGYALSGTDAGNYNLIQPSGLTANISAADRDQYAGSLLRRLCVPDGRAIGR